MEGRTLGHPKFRLNSLTMLSLLVIFYRLGKNFNIYCSMFKILQNPPSLRSFISHFLSIISIMRFPINYLNIWLILRTGFIPNSHFWNIRNKESFLLPKWFIYLFFFGITWQELILNVLRKFSWKLVKKLWSWKSTRNLTELYSICCILFLVKYMVILTKKKTPTKHFLQEFLCRLKLDWQKQNSTKETNK